MAGMGGDDQSFSDDLDGILGGGQQRSGFDDSDEFDPAALLSQPLFNDSQGDLNVSPNDLRYPSTDPLDMSNQSSTSSVSNQHNNHALLLQQQQQLRALQEQQQQFQQQQQQQSQGGFQQNQFGNFSNHGQQHIQNQNQFLPFNQGEPQQQNHSNDGFTMNDSQHNFQQLQFQNQQQTQMDNLNMMQQQTMDNQNMMPQQTMDSQNMIHQQQQQMDNQSMIQQQQPQHQQNFQNLSRGMNRGMNSGMEFTRAPPGRSVSMPIQRMHGNSMVSSDFSPDFILQHQQRPQQNQLQAMANSLNGSMQNMMFLQQQQNQNQMDTSQTSHTSLQMNSNMQGMQQQGLDGSFSSIPPMMGRNSLPLSPSSMQGRMQGQANMLPHSLQAQTGELLPTGSFNPMSAQAFAALAQANQGSDRSEPTSVNEAMEKLCESMRRSAMSRSLVKQLSGRSVPQRTNSNRMTKQLSGRSLSRANSGRGIGRANSGLSLQRSHSGRATLGGDHAPSLPVRRVAHDPKHRIQQLSNGAGQSRGVFRHKSNSAIIGVRRTPFHFDDNVSEDSNPNI